MGRASDSDSDNMDSGESITKVSVWDLPDVPQGKLLSHLELKRTRVFCASLAPTNVKTFLFFLSLHKSGV